MPISFDPSQRPPKRLQETFQLFGMDDCTPATAIGQPGAAAVANFMLQGIMVYRQPGEASWLERVVSKWGEEEGVVSKDVERRHRDPMSPLFEKSNDTAALAVLSPLFDRGQNKMGRTNGFAARSQKYTRSFAGVEVSSL